MLYLGYGGIHGLKPRMGLLRCRLPPLALASDRGDQPVVAEDAVMDDLRSLGYVGAIGPDAFRRRYVPLPGDLGVSRPV